MTTATAAYRYSRLRIRYFDVEVPAVAIGRAVYFPVKALTSALGMVVQPQVTKLRGLEKTDSRFTSCLRDSPIPTVKGLRDATCIRKQQVGLWLATLDPARCPLTAKGPLEAFQKELFDAADRFLFGDTSDAVYDAGTKQREPIVGTLSVGHCPGCGMALRLEYTESGAHLAPESRDNL